jgi:hypothetical protein
MHCGSNHKLVRWRFIIQGMIDGFSRMVLMWQEITKLALSFTILNNQLKDT